MPELPEVETTMRALRARLVGRTFSKIDQHRPDLRFPMPARLPARLRGRRILGFRRRAKFILVDLDRDETMLMHLGMSGRLVLDADPQGRHEHLTFTFDDGAILRFVDPRRFGMLGLEPTVGLQSHKWLAHLGIEPLDTAFCGGLLQAQFQHCISPVKIAIMDQRRVVGVGNIYASESLFAAQISPRRKARSVRGAVAERLADAVGDVLRRAIDAGGSSLRDYVQSSGELGNFQNEFKVYGREGGACPRCATPVKRTVQGNRATFYCPACQR